MTNEAEWLNAADPRAMLKVIAQPASARKLRLYVCGCIRHVWPQFRAEVGRGAVEVAERFADGAASTEELVSARAAVRATLELYPGEPEYDPSYYACGLNIQQDVPGGLFYAASFASFVVPFASPDYDDQADQVRAAEAAFQAALLGCIFPNPFRPVTFDTQWRTSTALSLAEGIYTDRAWDRMPILADALQDAGAEGDTLDHLRGPSPHALGCHVLDAVLGRT